MGATNKSETLGSIRIFEDSTEIIYVWFIQYEVKIPERNDKSFSDRILV